LASYAEELEGLRSVEQLDSFELRTQATLIGVCILAGWIFVGLDWLLLWFCVHYGFVLIEKFTVTSFPEKDSVWFFSFVLFINFLIGLSFAALPAKLWMVDAASYKLVAMVLLIGSTLNTFIFRSRVWQAMLCYVLPNSSVFFLATYLIYLEQGATAETIVAVIVAINITIYLILATYNAYQSYQDHVETRERLIQSQKTEAIGNLTGGVAHDFNNLLNIISTLTDRMLAFGRRSLLHPQPIDLEIAFIELDHMMQRLLPSNITLEMVADKDVPRVFADENALHISIINLCVNARDAMPNGGRIKISASLSDPKDHGSPDLVCISVSDNGTGIPKEIINKVTDPFMTTKPTGSGLGLAMVNGFVDQSLGKMTIESSKHSGTCISLFLPISNLPEKRPAITRRVIRNDVPQQEAGTARVLVVEDEQQLLSLMGAALKKEGFELREAANGVSALEIVQGGYEPDVVITDVVMPGPVQGTDLVRRLKQKLPQTQFVVLSGYASQADNLGELSLERVVFQQKPVRMQQLVSIVKGVLANAE
jgi:signal transduction histidine kinase